MQVCREDDDVDILELGRMDDIDSEDEDEDEDEDNIDDPDYNTDTTSPSGADSVTRSKEKYILFYIIIKLIV